MSQSPEAETCRKYVLPRLYAADWTDDQITEEKSFTDGRIVVAGDKPRRRPQKRADYLLRQPHLNVIGLAPALADSVLVLKDWSATIQVLHIGRQS